MYRLEIAVLLLALLPLIMAIIFSTAVMPRRRSGMVDVLNVARATSIQGVSPEPPEAVRYLDSSIDRVTKDFGSLYVYRLLIPAALLSTIYVLGMSIGLSLILEAGCSWFMCRTITCVDPAVLVNPICGVIGAYVFNMGVAIRRSFMADLTKNVYWASVNRVVLSAGLAVAVYFGFGTHAMVCFAIAFFPRLFLTMLRKQATKLLGVPNSAVQELDIQLVQGIDVWKEERLEEEGIESVQNLATADVLDLAVKTHYPMRTIVDWIDQAIFIQRFPFAFSAMQKAGFSVSAIDLALLSSSTDDQVIREMAEKSGVNVLVLKSAMEIFASDAVVRVLWRLWESNANE